MDISISEFSYFNLKSKKKILEYKARLLGTYCMRNNDKLLLYALNATYVTLQLCHKTNAPVHANPCVSLNELLLFAPKTVHYF